MAAAATLPPELLQSILLITDYETFYASRLTCRAWYHAASTAYLLRKALEKTPTARTLPPTLTGLSEKEWNVLFEQVSKSNLLGHWLRGANKRVYARKAPEGCTLLTLQLSSRDGGRVVALRGARVCVYNHHQHSTPNRQRAAAGGEMQMAAEFDLALSFYPLWPSVCRALLESCGGGAGSGYGINRGYAKHRLAVSSRGTTLVAVGLGRTIQVYDYSGTESLSHPVEYVLGDPGTTVYDSASDAVAPLPGANYIETDGVVDGLEFADDDERLLRVVIGKESDVNRGCRVRYLGNPSAAALTAQSPLEYWRQNLNRVYVDSVALASNLPNSDYKTAFKGLRLLPRSPSPSSYDGDSDGSRSFIAALQSQSSPQYCIGHIAKKTLHLTASLPSKTTATPPPPPRSRSSPQSHPSQSQHLPQAPIQPIQLSPLLDDKITVSTNLDTARTTRFNPVHLPAATTKNPLLAVSSDGRVLVVYEAGGGHSYRFLSGGAVYIFSLDGDAVDEGMAEVKAPTWPYLLDIVDVDVEGVTVKKNEGVNGDGRGYTVTAWDGPQVLQWVIGA